VELTASAGHLDGVTVPLGDGALLAGIGAAIRHLAPQTEIIGVVAEEAPALQLSLAAGRLIETPDSDTIADGIAARVPVPEALALLEGLYDSIVAVTEAQIVNGMRLAHQHLGLVIEPAGAVGLAAIAADPHRFRGKRIATILTGSNISDAMRQRLLG
jgi:threonine dehydratase